MPKDIYTPEQYHKAMELFAQGYSKRTVGKMLGIPVGTVYDWHYRGVKPQSVQPLHCSEKTKRKLRELRMGEKNPMWKGDNVKYLGAGHQRARRRYNPPPEHLIHHIDGNPLNNDPSNIEFLTRKEHIARHKQMREEK